MTVSADYKRKIFAIRDLPTLPIIAQKIMSLGDDDETLAEKLGNHHFQRPVAVGESPDSRKFRLLRTSRPDRNDQESGRRHRNRHAPPVFPGRSRLQRPWPGQPRTRNILASFADDRKCREHSSPSAPGCPTPKSVSWADCCTMSASSCWTRICPRNTSRSWRWSRMTIVPLIEAEREVFDTDHTEVGAWMAERWQLPPELVQSIGFHHSLDIAALPHSRIVAIVHAASVCAEAAELMELNSLDEPQVSHSI